MPTFSERVLDVLRRAGWSEERRVDTTEYEEYLRSQGYPVHPVVLDFLSRFGGLRLYPDYDHPGTREVCFDVTDTPGSLAQNARYDSLIMGTRLCLIGEFEDHYITLTMDENGTVYYRYGRHFGRVGNSGEDAIEAICTGGPFEDLSAFCEQRKKELKRSAKRPNKKA